MRALALALGLAMLLLVQGPAAAESNCASYRDFSVADAGRPGLVSSASLGLSLDPGEKLTIMAEAPSAAEALGGEFHLSIQDGGGTELSPLIIYDYSGSGIETLAFTAQTPISGFGIFSFLQVGGNTLPVKLSFKCSLLPAATETTLQASAPTSTAGTDVTFTATIKNLDKAEVTPTGVVAVYSGTTLLGSAYLAAGTANITTNQLSIAQHSVTAYFLANDDFKASTSNTLVHEVIDPNAVDTAVTLTSSNLQPFIAEEITLEAKVTAETETPTGAVKFVLAGTGVIGEAPLVNGVARLPYTVVNAGINNITAEYSATPGFKSSSSNNLRVDVQLYPTETTITTSKNPTRPGEVFNVTVTVMDTYHNAIPQSGFIRFYINDQQVGSIRRLGGVPLVYRIPLPAGLPQLVVGENEIRAVYAASVLAGSQAILTQKVDDSEATTNTTLTSSKNPAVVGESVTFSASVVTSDTGAKATGNVEFYNGDTLLGSSALADGVATVTSSFNDVGELQITARYLGEANAFAASTSAALTQRIDKFGTSVSLSSTPNPSQQGQEVSLTATVASAAGTPAGTVEFFDGAVSLGTTALSGGSAVLSTSALTAGSHDLTAVYSGSVSEATSTSAVLPHGVGTESAKLDKVQQQATQAVAGVSADVITATTSEVISDALSGQVQVLSASDGKVGLTWAPGLTRGGTMIQPTADALPTTDSSWRFWMKGRYTNWDAGSLDGKLWNGMAGASLLFGDGMVAGLAAGYESYDYEDTVGATLKGDGLSLGGYVGGKMTDNLTIDTQLHSVFINYDVAAGAVSGDFDATRLVAAGGFAYALHEGAFSFTPSLRANAMWEWQDGYVDTAAVAHASRGFGNARASGGARVAYTIPLNDGGRLTPYVSGFGDWRVSDGDQTTDSALDGVSGRIESGFDLQTKGGINFGASVEFMGLGIEDTLATSYRANLSIPF